MINMVLDKSCFIWKSCSRNHCQINDIVDVYGKTNTLEPLYKTVHYKTVSDIKDILKVDPKSVVAKQKCIDYIGK